MGFNWETTTYTKTGIVIKSADCDNCKEPIELWDNHQTWATAKEALRIRFGGGYGWYFDYVDEGPEEMLFCKTCADKLVEEYPCFTKALAPFR